MSTLRKEIQMSLTQIKGDSDTVSEMANGSYTEIQQFTYQIGTYPKGFREGHGEKVTPFFEGGVCRRAVGRVH